MRRERVGAEGRQLGIKNEELGMRRREKLTTEATESTEEEREVYHKRHKKPKGGDAPKGVK